MRKRPESRKPGVAAPGSKTNRQSIIDSQCYNVTPPPAQEIVATIDKARCAQLRVSLTAWRGDHKIELREATASIPGIYFPTSAGVTLALELLPELIAALAKAERHAIAAGLLNSSLMGRSSPCIVVRSQPAVAVYLNPHNEVVIRQEGLYGPDEDQFIFVTKYNVATVAKAMLQAAGLEMAEAHGALAAKQAALSGAERQRRYRTRHRNGNGDASVTESDEPSLRTVTARHQLELVG